MAAGGSERESGYQLNRFIGEVSDDLLCGICRLVAREPHSTNCCGEHFCKNCITQVLDASKPCPSCSQTTFSAIFPDIRDQKRILALRIYCTMKDRGCEWVGKLEDLQAHLLVDSNDCQYVDIQCPNKCGESVPRHQLLSHLADSCLNRDHFCKYCNFSGSYRVVCYEHWPKCPHYPVQCPNGCSVGTVERGDLEDHMKVCLLQEVSCDLCKETFLCEDEDRHMEQNTHKHLLLVSAMSQRMFQEFEQKLQEQREEKEREIQQMLDENKKKREEPVTQAREEFDQKLQEQREENEREMKRMQQMLDESEQKREEQLTRARKERDDQIRALEEKREQEIKALRENSDRAMKSLKDEKDKQIREIQTELENLTYQLQVQGIVQGTVRSPVQLQHVPYRSSPPVCFTVRNFNKLKTDNQQWTSPDLYTHEGGHMIRFTVHPNGAANHITVTVSLHAKPGELDQHVEGSNPVKATITLQLLNQYRDRGHFDLTWECEWSKQSGPTPIDANTGSIPHADLAWSHQKKTQFLKNDCLVFRLTKVALNRKLCTIL